MSNFGGDFFGPENAGMLWALTFGGALLVFIFWVFIQWRTFAKAGFPGALALINFGIFIPIVGVLILLGLQVWFAFADWPALKRQTP